MGINNNKIKRLLTLIKRYSENIDQIRIDKEAIKQLWTNGNKCSKMFRDYDCIHFLKTSDDN